MKVCEVEIHSIDSGTSWVATDWANDMVYTANWHLGGWEASIR